jgi:mRNA interferase RelE/StbE
MPYEILYHPLVASDDISGIPANMALRIKHAIEERLMKEPLFAGKPLRRSLRGHRKLRIGDYRVIYRVEKDTILILKIGHRKEVYLKMLSRMTKK